MREGTDGDVKAIKGALKALRLSSSPRMLRANLEYLWDYFVAHPSSELPEHLGGPPREDVADAKEPA